MQATSVQSFRAFTIKFNFTPYFSVDVNECMMSPPVCQNGGTCYNSYGSFVCRCPPEWTGPTCIEGIVSFWKSLFMVELRDNCVQNFHLGRYIFRYTVGNLVLRRRVSGAVKRDFRTYIRRYTSPNENFEHSYPHSNAFLQSHLKYEHFKPHKAACRPKK